MKTPTSIHDGLFKSFLTVPETAEDFLNIHLPEHIKQICNLDTLQLQSGSFLEEELVPYYSDVLYSMETDSGVGYVYALIEHQSSPDKHMGFRMMRYAIAAMKQHLDAGNDTLPLVVPLLFYHGRTSPYPYSTNWLDEFENPEIAKALYSQDFPLVDVTVISDDEIIRHKRVALLELVQKHVQQRDLLDFTDTLVTLLLERLITTNQLDSLVEYLLRVGETSNLEGLMRTLAQQVPEHEERFMTVAEQLEARGREQGLKQGLKQGLEQGRQEGEEFGRQEGQQAAKLAIAKRMLAAGLDKSLISETTGLSEKELLALIN
ncbi:Rpn family recombination-promoting nuclease/putative transposase [Vibrio vulnificus]|nr:Rpn family recombination-promoting nuclease/putative transposase [Vibrio vulnificus]EGQ7988626.1 Rpn family recombination-promoting nuclease/putative transposase [Vibrio vulnificus]EGQ9240218.1 Rpn family recombination-promoting nuclease/putative transposase [Vibrio vulnificus]EGR0354124.1 Rpn family recombination-promoting nuclease/putative transposase [Vibrio vulnificus]EGR0637505.1 Rpn family recombination-promoting nuclease/putative transposase [Vibrio vulnificus]